MVVIFAPEGMLLIYSPRPSGAGGKFLLQSARDLRGPGLRAYFCHAAKVGKNAPEPYGSGLL